MTFKEAMEHYRSGNANEEERLLVEQELEKSQLIAEYLDDQWEDAPIIAEASNQDMKQVRKNLRKRNIVIVLTSLVLAAALMLSVVYVAIPAVESMYWDPNETSYDASYSTDLELTIASYVELFCPDMIIASVNATKTGFAAYDISIQYWNAHRGGDSLFASAVLEKDTLTFPSGLIRFESMNIFERGTYPTYSLDTASKEAMYEKLSALPDYVTVTAAVSFAEDKNMEELIAFQDSLEDGSIGWTGIRNSPEDQQLLPLCGMNPYAFGSIRDGANESYPCLDNKGMERTPENLEAHFKSLLKYSADQVAKGTGIAEQDADGSSYYSKVLAYVEENGVYSYGCYISATPETILKLLDSGEITQAWVQDAWILF